MDSDERSANESSRRNAAGFLLPRPEEQRLLGADGVHAQTMGAPANAFPDRSRATEDRRNGSAGPERHGTCRNGPAETVSGIEREGWRCCCADSKRICGSCRERAAGAASRFPVRAADCLLESGELVARAFHWQEKSDVVSPGAVRLPVSNHLSISHLA